MILSAAWLVPLCILYAAPTSSLPKQWSVRERSAASQINPRALASRIRFLSSDLLEGRGPGARGGETAMQYIASEFERMGFTPVGDSSTYLQKFQLVGLKSVITRVPIVHAARGESITLQPPTDVIVAPGAQEEQLSVDGAEIVFGGYGIVAPEQKWDDFKGVDMRGRVLLLMNNDPSEDPALFAGKTRLYYGRWTYKYEEAARKGAAGVILIHTTPSAGYPWQVVQSSWQGETFQLPMGSEPRLRVRMWATEEAARKLTRLGGHDLDTLRKAAERRDFRPVPLGLKLSVALATTLRQVETANVLGQLPGNDPTLSKELVVYTAHHDHLGIRPSKSNDTIYNGALDNGAGVATLLSIAEGFAAGDARPKRSILFAAVGAEESNLLGSKYFCMHPNVPARNIAANLNMDGANIWGSTRDVTYIGLGKSSLDRLVTIIAAEQGRVVRPDQFPDRGHFYRSDQFSFAQIGVPAIYLESGTDFIGRPTSWGREQIEEYERQRYHQPSDEFERSWNLSGAVEDAQLLLVAGLRIANEVKPPTWTPGDEFESARR